MNRRTLLLIGTTLAMFAGAVAYYVFTWGSIRNFVVQIDHCPVLFCDFVYHYHPMGRQFFETRSPVEGYYYTPFFAILLTFFGAMPPRSAMISWAVFQGVAVLGLFVPGAVFLARRSRTAYWLYAGAFLLALPVLNNLKWGQMSIALTALVLGCLFLYRSGYTILAALALALTVAVKYYTGLFLLIFLIKLDWKFLTAFTVFMLIFALIVPMLFVGFGDTVTFYRLIKLSVTSDQVSLSTDTNSQYIPHVIARVAAVLGGQKEPGPEWTSTVSALSWIGYLGFVLNLAIVVWVTRREFREDTLWTFSLVFMSFPLIIPTSWPHYFVFLPFFQGLVARTMLGRPLTWGRGIQWALVAVSVLANSLLAFNAIDSWKIYGFFGTTLLANLSLLIVVYWLIFARSSRNANLNATSS